MAKKASPMLLRVVFLTMETVNNFNVKKVAPVLELGGCVQSKCCVPCHMPICWKKVEPWIYHASSLAIPLLMMTITVEQHDMQFWTQLSPVGVWMATCLPIPAQKVETTTRRRWHTISLKSRKVIVGCEKK